MNAATMLNYVLSVVTAISLGLAGWALSSVQNHSIELSSVKKDLEQLRSDTRDATEFRLSIRKHWRLLGWSRDQINTLRTNQSPPMPVASWPDLE